MTYAFVDQGSTTTLCDKRLLNHLEDLGKKVEFNISTINEKSIRRRATKVSLTLSSLIGPDTLVLPEVSSVDNLPTNHYPPLSQKDPKTWPHLRNLKLPQINGAVTVLNEVDVPEAFWIEEERRVAANSPMPAVKSTFNNLCCGLLPPIIMVNQSKSADWSK